jgi:hypothetical protein
MASPFRLAHCTIFDLASCSLCHCHDCITLHSRFTMYITCQAIPVYVVLRCPCSSCSSSFVLSSFPVWVNYCTRLLLLRYVIGSMMLRIRTHDRSRQAAVDLPPRPHGYWDRRRKIFRSLNMCPKIALCQDLRTEIINSRYWHFVSDWLSLLYKSVVKAMTTRKARPG